MSQTDSDSQERDFQDDVSRTSTDVSETSMRTDKSERRRNMALKEMKESLINTGLDEQSAKDKAFSNMLPKLQKSRVDGKTKERSST